MKRINVYVSSVLRWETFKDDDEYLSWLNATIASNVWGAPGSYTYEVLDANAEWAEIIAKNEVVTKIFADENYYKKSDILGAVSTIVEDNLSTSKALVSDAQGKVAASSTTSSEIGHLSGVTSSVQTQLDGKQATVTGAATSVLSSDLTASKVVVSDANGKIAASSVASSDLANLSGTTSSVQTQIDSKANKTNTTLTGTINWKSSEEEATIDISELISFTSTMGLIEGGQLTVNSGLTINVARTIGYASDSEDYATQLLKKIDAAATTLLLPASSSVYVYYTAGSVLSYNVTQPNERSNIILGRVVTNATSVVYIEKSQLDAHHWSNYTDVMLKEAFGSIFASGSIITENGSNARQLDMTNGVYFYSEHRLTLAEETSLSFNAYYRNGSGGYTVQSPSSTVSNSLYDDGSGTLASIPTDKYVKHLLVGIKEQTGNQKFLLFYGDSNWSTEAEAISAELPATPDFVKNTFVRLASIIVKQGATAIQEIIDERPRVGFSPSAVSAAVVTDHGALSGLADDDHTQYLLANGSRAMSGNLDMNGNDIVSLDTVNGVVVEAHASRHQPGGADAIPTATAVSIASSNAEGTSTSLARADHTHKIDDSFVTNSMLAGSVDAAKISSGTVSNTEFDYLNGVTSGIQAQIDGKEPTITGAATSITGANLTINRALTSDASGKVAVSATTSTELGYVSGVTSAVQTQIDGKQATIIGAATTITNSNLTVSRAVVSDASGKIDISPTTSTEIGFVSGVTSAIQTQLNGKQATITGAASTITTANLTVDRALISDAGGKVTQSATTSAEIGFVSGVTSAIQTQLNGKESTITGAATTITSSDLTVSRALTSDANGKVSVSATTSAELGFLSGVTSSVQTQLNGKQATGDYITALTGDVTASGPGSATATLADSGVVAGTYDLVTVDAKGRVTVGSNTRYTYSNTAAVATTSVTPTSVTELTTVSLPAGLYAFKFHGNMQSAALNTGVGIRVAPVTATMTTVSAKWNIAQGANGTAHDFEYDQVANNTNITSASVAVANSNFSVNGLGVFRLTVAGTVAIQTRTETAGTAATLQLDSAFILELV
jgi:fructose-specific component phosphotransferase system IIB-like protein